MALDDPKVELAMRKLGASLVHLDVAKTPDAWLVDIERAPYAPPEVKDKVRAERERRQGAGLWSL